MSSLVEWPDIPQVPLPVHLLPCLPLCRCPHMSQAPHLPGLLGPAEASNLAQGWVWGRKTLGSTSDRGRVSPEGPSSGPPLPPPLPVCMTLSLLARASEPCMSEESPWRWWQPSGRAEAGRAVEMGSSLVPHPQPQGPQPLAGRPRPPSTSPYLSCPHSLPLPSSGHSEQSRLQGPGQAGGEAAFSPATFGDGAVGTQGGVELGGSSTTSPGASLDTWASQTRGGGRGRAESGFGPT